jgi:hypothetical protein
MKKDSSDAQTSNSDSPRIEGFELASSAIRERAGQLLKQHLEIALTADECKCTGARNSLEMRTLPPSLHGKAMSRSVTL